MLRRVDYSETSQVVTLFTAVRGKIGAIAKGARRSKTKFFGPLDAATMHDVVLFARAQGLWVLAESHLVERFPALRRNLETIYVAHLVIELLDMLTEENDPSPALFELAVDVLGETRDPAKASLYALKFIAGALARTGFAPVLDRCVGCAREAPSGRRLAFDVVEGGLLCATCARNAPQAAHTSGAAVALIRYVTRAGPGALKRLKPAKRDVDKALGTLGAHTERAAGRRLKTLPLVVKGQS